MSEEPGKMGSARAPAQDIQNDILAATSQTWFGAYLRITRENVGWTCESPLVKISFSPGAPAANDVVKNP